MLIADELTQTQYNPTHYIWQVSRAVDPWNFTQWSEWLELHVVADYKPMITDQLNHSTMLSFIISLFGPVELRTFQFFESLVRILGVD